MIVSVTAPISPSMRERIKERVEKAGGRILFADRPSELEESPTIHFGDAGIGFVRSSRSLRWLQTSSAGVDRLTMAEEPFPSNVLLTNASGVFGVAGAEHLLGMMLYFARGFDFYFANQRRGEWVRDLSHARLLRGSTVVLLGLGNLGQEFVRRAKAFDLHIIGVRRGAGPVDGVDLVVTSEQLDEVLPLADHLVITLPLTRETERLIDARRLALLRPTAYLYNIGRGAVVDQEAITDALLSGRLAGAGLDVFVEEPLPPASPLWQMENVLITPHIGADTPWDYDAAAEIFLENFDLYLQGKQLRNLVDPQRGY